MPAIFIWIIVTLIVTALAVLFLVNMPTTAAASPNREITFPDNSAGKIVPRLYGKHRMFGNAIYAGNIDSAQILIDDGAK